MSATRDRLHAWAMLLSRFVAVQLLVQLLGFAGGMLLVRRLSKEQYAFFTIANTLLGTMNLLADSGVGSGLTSIGGRVWDTPARLGQLVRTGLQLRRGLGLAAILAVAPCLGWL